MLFAKYAFPLLVSLISFSQGKLSLVKLSLGKSSSKGSYPSLNMPASFSLTGTYGITSVDNLGKPILRPVTRVGFVGSAQGYIAADSVSNSIA